MANFIYLLPIKASLRTAWDKIHGSKKTVWAAIGMTVLIVFLCAVIEGLITTLFPRVHPVTDAILKLIAYLLQIGLLYIGIKRAQDQPIFYNMIFKTFELRTGLYVIILQFLQTLILTIPIALTLLAFQLDTKILGIILIILFIPFVIYLLVRMGMATAFILDQEKNPWTAIVLSFRITRGNFWRLLLIVIAQTLIILVSMVPLGLGLIWSIPFSLILYGVIFKNLLVNLTNTEASKQTPL